MAKKKSKSMKKKGELTEYEESLNSSSEYVNKLLSEANEHISNFEYELAKALCEKAVAFDPSNCKALETLAGVLLDLGLKEEAASIYNQCVQIAPEEGHTKYFSLGQLSSGFEAINYYLKGLQILDAGLEHIISDSEEKQKLLLREKSTAYCSLSEIYMTDCCYEIEAESECNKYIQLGIEADSTNPEIFLCLANFQTVLGNIEDAKSAIKTSLSLWMPQCKEDVAEENSCTDYIQFCPLSYDTRINCSRLCIETSMFSEASEVLYGLIEEDDEVPDTWYLLGLLNYLQGKEFWEEACYCFIKMKEICDKLHECNYEQLSHVDELLKEINNGIKGENKEDSTENKENGR